LLVAGAGDRVAKFCRIALIELPVIARQLCSDVCELPRAQMLKKVEENKRRWGSKRCSELAKSITVSQSREPALAVISMRWAGQREQYLGFIKYRDFTWAFSNTITFDAKALLLLIAHRAAMLSAFEIVRISQRYFIGMITSFADARCMEKRIHERMPFITQLEELGLKREANRH
jgi:hypothetical protein